MKHYVYRITNIILHKHYYGSRTTSIEPVNDIGVFYFSSSSDSDFIQDQKDNPQNYKYKVVKLFNTRDSCIEYEVKLHNKLKVSIRDNFYNKSKQGKTRADFASTVTCRDKAGNIFIVPADKFYNDVQLVGFNSGIKQSAESNKKRSDTLKLKNRNRWMNPRAQADKTLMDMWANSQIIYNAWLEFDKPGIHKLRKITGSKVVEQMLNSFRNGWIPENDEEWVKYFSSYSLCAVIDIKPYYNANYIIEQYKNEKLINTYNSISEAARETGADVSSCTRGIQKTSKGYQFKKIDRNERLV